jgi:dihydropteroate synthase
MRNVYTWKLCRTVVQLGKRTAVMGILNVTPDSFSDGGRYFDFDTAVARGKDIEQNGADLVDIGGESSRPGSTAVPEAEEIRRVVPVIEALARVLKIPISVDTYRAGIAKRAIEVGAQIVNDISAFRFDEQMAAVVQQTRAGVVLMHSRGTRETLHQQDQMADAVRDVTDSLLESAENARRIGIAADAVVLDPGIGFGKAAAESISILRNLYSFSRLGYPLLVGTSRKSFIRSLTPETVDARNWGTAATIVATVMNGAHIVRVHDVAQARVLADVADRLS